MSELTRAGIGIMLGIVLSTFFVLWHITDEADRIIAALKEKDGKESKDA